MAVETPAGVIDGESTPASVVRHMLQAVLGAPVGSFSGGVSAANAGAHGVTDEDSLVVTQQGTPGMGVTVSSGLALITGTVSAAQGPASFYNDADVDVTIAAADATNPRKDLVIAQFEDSLGGTTRLTVVTGTPAASPADPSLSSYPNALVLARVAVAANATSITNANITDLRSLAGMAYAHSLDVSYTAWTAYTPAIGGAGWSLGTTGSDAQGAYCVVNDVVFFWARLVFGTSGATFSGSVPQVTLPVNADASHLAYSARSSVEGVIVDTDLAKTYSALFELNASYVNLMCFVTSGSYEELSYVVGTVPFTWAASDVISLSGWYRKA